ncbi:MAG: ATP-binding cassette domain-containing protein [Alphaproteobacteria bacterium]|nr:ATP-binding cassette domain-containing protein [Alphaproteobacteria bacterium]
MHLPGRGRPRLAGVDLALSPDVLTVVVGPNGSGKSSLLAALLGQVRPTQGTCEVDGRAASAWSPRARAAHLAWLPQDPVLEEGITAREAVAAARYRHDEPWRTALHEAEAALARHDLASLADAPMQTLSGGEAQRVRLAALEAQAAAWWLLDEPGNHLDAAVQLQLLEVLRARVHGGGGVLLVTHSLPLLPHLAGTPTRVVGLAQGRVAVDASLDDPSLPERLGALVGLQLRTVEVDGLARWVVVDRR